MSRARFASLVLSNLSGRPARSAALVLSTAAVVGLMLSSSLIERASWRGLEIGLERLGADLVVVPRGSTELFYDTLVEGEPSALRMDETVEQRIAAFSFVAETTPQVYVQSLAASCCSAWRVLVIGFDPIRDFTVRPWLAEDRDRRIGPRDILIGAGIDFDLREPFKLYGQELRVAGVLDVSGTGLDTTVFVPLTTVRRIAALSFAKAVKPLELGPREISAVLVRLRRANQTGAEPLRAALALEQAIPEIAAVAPDDLLARVKQNLRSSSSLLGLVSAAAWPIATLLAALIFTLAVAERQREIGLLRAVGATREFVFRLIVTEAVVLALAGAALGVVVAYALLAAFSGALAAYLGVPFLLDDPRVAIGPALAALLLAASTGALAALYAALHASFSEPYQAIRRGEK